MYRVFTCTKGILHMKNKVPSSSTTPSRSNLPIYKSFCAPLRSDQNPTLTCPSHSLHGSRQAKPPPPPPRTPTRSQRTLNNYFPPLISRPSLGFFELLLTRMCVDWREQADDEPPRNVHRKDCLARIHTNPGCLRGAARLVFFSFSYIVPS